MAQLSAADMNNLPDSAFAYVEPGGERDSAGKTVPRSKRHFPVHDEAHTRNALSRAPQSPFGKNAMPKILAAARKFGIEVDGNARAAFGAIEDYSAHPERRFTLYPPEIRQGGRLDASDAKHIVGYASVFNRLSRKLGGFVEQVNPTAFNETRASGWPDVVCRYNHNDDQLLGTTFARTLDLSLDGQGLLYDVIPPQARSDVLEYIQRGDVRHSSFAFRVHPGGDEWGLSDFSYPMRTLHSVELIDVAPVLSPAYPDATAGIRALAGAVESLAQWVQAEPDEVRTYLDNGRATEFFKRSDRSFGPKIAKEQPRKLEVPRMTGAQALVKALEMQNDPWGDEDAA